ncbi:MAG: hypothetical protein GX384_06030 [Clostridiaceae bacterium]|jgi:hypothetical protein|nr:HlyD family efflux transporter periplasmic adaptor subunit [Bacillota bacterium]NLI38887.1 hypothetical protein [Clostridiaceae bacterium]
MQMTKSQERNMQKKKKKKRNRRRLFSLLVLVLMMIYMPALWNWLFSSNTEIAVIKTATLEVTTPLSGVIIRKEQLLISPGSGILIPTVSYGEKVGANQEVATLINKEMKDLVENYRQMEIELLKRVISEYETATGSDRKIWEEAIEKQISKLTDYSNSGDLSDLGSIRNSMDRVLEARARTILESLGSNSRFGPEIEELERLKKSQAKSVQSIRSPASGVVSYYCDGYESWTPDERKAITFKDIDEVLADETGSEKWITPPEIEVRSEDHYGKLVTNDEAWLVFYISKDMAKELQVMFEKQQINEKQLELQVELDGMNQRIPVIIEGFGESDGNKWVVVASMTRYIELTMDMRGVTGNLILQSVSGMKVPLESLVNINSVDQTADIIVIDMSKARYRRVRIMAKQDYYAIIENLAGVDEEELVNIFDLYIVDPRNIEEGQVIDL